MSKTTRRAVAFLTLPVMLLGTTAFAQTVTPGATGIERAAPAVAEERARIVPAQFGGHRKGSGRRGRGQMMLRVLADADANDDGSLTQDEIDQFLAAQLTGADASGDGTVSLEEFQTIYLERTRPLMVDAFQRLDEDGDGQITSGELSDRFGNIVQRMDRNGDDALSADDRRGRGDRGRRNRRDREGR